MGVSRVGGKATAAVPPAKSAKPASARRAEPERAAPGGWQPKAPASPGEARLKALETSTRPVSADELTGVFVELRAASPRGVPQPTLDRFRQVAEKAIDGALAAAQARPAPSEFRAVQAENLGKLLVLARGCLENRHQPPASLTAREGQVRDFMQGVVNQRVGELKALAQRAGSDPAGAIRDAESLKVSLDGDLSRLYRYGFEPPRLDTAALVRDVSASAVQSFGRR
jgi:hypothetical protein